jgi:hypothetical protein
MPDEKAVLARARDYMRELSEGRDPLTGREVDDEVLGQPRLRRCFAFVAAYLQRELTRATEEGEIFLPTDEQADRICCDEDIPAAEFYERLNATAVALGKPPIAPRTINHFLIEAGFADGRVESVFVERRVLRAGVRSEEVGIYDKPRLSPRTGALTYTLMFPPETQRWLLRCLPDILAPKEEIDGEGGA